MSSTIVPRAVPLANNSASSKTSQAAGTANSNPTSWWREFIDPVFPVAAAVTAIFYTVIAHPSMHDSLLRRYATEHAVEYIIVAFFIWGVVDAAYKLLDVPVEFLAIRKLRLPETRGTAQAQAAGLIQEIGQLPRWQQRSRVSQRLKRAYEYVERYGMSERVEEHLEVLSLNDADQVHASYGLVRFVIWVSPVLGFLGTVIHFGIALSGISIEEMADRLPDVVSGMGTAFNTTTAALATATTMMFAVFVCERCDRRIGQAVDRIATQEVFTRFQSLSSAVHSTHDRAPSAMSAALAALAEQQQQAEAVQNERFERFMTMLRDTHRQPLTEIHDAIENLARAQRELGQFVGGLNEMARAQHELNSTQASLAENLRLLRDSGQFEASLHELTAAIHLLTARSRNHASVQLARSA